jgi:membrane-bound lytic murein transglycosylase D
VSAPLLSKAGFNRDSILLAGNSTSRSVTKTIVKDINVVYPSILSEHMDESMEYVQKFSDKKRKYLINIYQRGKNYFPKVAAVLNRYHLPEELKVLIALESAFNPNAVSSAGAVGYWQFMDDAAREYGLQIPGTKSKNKKDDRKNFSKSTLAAAKYLQDRGRNLNNDVLLIVASYNWGIGNVRNALKKTGKINPGFWDIKKYLPSETKAYVMNFIALNVIFLNYDKFVSNKLLFAKQETVVPVSDNPARLNTSITD